MTPAIKRQMKRHAAVEPVIGHIKSGHRMGSNYPAHTHGDAINPLLAAAVHNFRLILKWIRLLWLQICWMLLFNHSAKIVQSAKIAQSAIIVWITVDKIVTM